MNAISPIWPIARHTLKALLRIQLLACGNASDPCAMSFSLFSACVLFRLHAHRTSNSIRPITLFYPKSSSLGFLPPHPPSLTGRQLLHGATLYIRNHTIGIISALWC